MNLKRDNQGAGVWKHSLQTGEMNWNVKDSLV